MDRVTLRAALAVAMGGLFVAGACTSSPDASRMTYIGPFEGGLTTAPDYEQFKVGVDPYLEQRCATLDCHGQLGRGLRLFSWMGLRAFDAAVPLDAGPDYDAATRYFDAPTGHPPTGEDEIRLNFISVVALEPELMAQVIAEGGNQPDRLLLLKKPRLLEGHKGGQVMIGPQDNGYRCVTSWIAGTLDQAACQAALAQ